MRRPRGILFDLDGVIYNGETPIEGAAEVIAWVRREYIPFLFVTNTTSRPRQTLIDKLHSMGITAAVNEIWTPAVAANLWLRERGIAPVALFVPPQTATEFQGIAVSGESAKAVVIGDLGQAWDFATLNRAFRCFTPTRKPNSSLLAWPATGCRRPDHRWTSRPSSPP